MNEFLLLCFVVRVNENIYIFIGVNLSSLGSTYNCISDLCASKIRKWRSVLRAAHFRCLLIIMAASAATINLILLYLCTCRHYFVASYKMATEERIILSCLLQSIDRGGYTFFIWKHTTSSSSITCSADHLHSRLNALQDCRFVLLVLSFDFFRFCSLFFCVTEVCTERLTRER